MPILHPRPSVRSCMKQVVFLWTAAALVLRHTAESAFLASHGRPRNRARDVRGQTLQAIHEAIDVGLSHGVGAGLGVDPVHPAATAAISERVGRTDNDGDAAPLAWPFTSVVCERAGAARDIGGTTTNGAVECQSGLPDETRVWFDHHLSTLPLTYSGRPRCITHGQKEYVENNVGLGKGGNVRSCNQVFIKGKLNRMRSH